MHKSSRPAPSTVISIVALFFALGGSAVAISGRNTVDAGDIKVNAVRQSEIAKGAVKGGEIATGVVRSGEIAKGAVKASEVASNAVDSSEIAGSAVGASEIAAAAVSGSEVVESGLAEVPQAADADTLDGKDSTRIVAWAFISDSAGGPASVIRSSPPGATVYEPNATFPNGATKVTFPFDVSDCGIGATPALEPIPDGDAHWFIEGQIAVAPTSNAPNNVKVRTADVNGVSTDRTYFIHAFC